MGEALLEPWGPALALCQRPRVGVADDKVVHAHVDRLVQELLGEEPLLPSVPSFDLGGAEDREVALERLESLVGQAAREMGGEDGCCGATPARTPAAQPDRAGGEPAGWVAQELVTLSVHPTVCGSALEPRHVDLRPYALASPARWSWPVRSARGPGEGLDVLVNSGKGGGAKDTWLPA